MSTWLIIFIASVVVIIFGVIIGFIASWYFFKWQLKKNPPISKEMIRATFLQANKKLSKKQVDDIYAKVMSHYKKK
ncbi:YneF family protein [symbiont of Argiope bruennichi]|uniref:YneF family protein n=1 Tax=symbiont of Argiope bruennichi TaxID=2810479 RepID=UPI003DA2AD0F